LADSLHVVNETNESNNNASIVVPTCPARPNLQAFPVAIAGNMSNGTGVLYFVNFTTRNNGLATSGPSITRTSYAGENQDHPISWLPVDGRMSLIRIVACRPTATNFIATADVYNNVSEMNEVDNTFVISIPACPAFQQPDLIISSLTVPGSMIQGRVYNAIVTTRNNGTGISVPSTTRVTYGGRLVATVPVPALNPNDQLQATFSMGCTGSENGDGVVATADFENTNAESNELNNVANGRSACVMVANINSSGVSGGSGGRQNPNAISPTSAGAGTGGKQAAPEKGTADKTAGGPNPPRSGILSSIGLGFVDDFFAWLGSLFGGK